MITTSLRRNGVRAATRWRERRRWRGWGESAADGVQLVVEAAEAVMSGFCILVLIMVMMQIHRITVRV